MFLCIGKNSVNMKHFLILISLFFVLNQTLLAETAVDSLKSYKTNTLTSGTVVYLNPDTLASFPEGENGLKIFISQNLRYPLEAMKRKIQGTIYVRMVIKGNGEITNIEVRRGHELLQKEAIRVVSLMPDFIPAKADGKNVASYFTLPFRFVMLK